MNKSINRLKVVLAEKNVKNKMLAEKINKTQSTVSLWCSNERQPSLETLHELSIVLQVDIRELLNSTK